MGKIKQAFTGEGSIWMWLIVAISVMAMSVVIERFVFIYFKYNINARAFMDQIRKYVVNGNIEKAIKLCNAAPDKALPRVIKAGLTKANDDEVQISNAIEEASLEVVPQVMRRLSTLQALANLATLMGLLGTIIGLIASFEALRDAPADKKQEYLATGISLAMNTTAFGLIVAIPTLFMHMLLSSQSKKIVEEIDQYSVQLENLLISRKSGQS